MNTKQTIKILNDNLDIQKSYIVMHELRPNLLEADYLETVLNLQKGGYQLAALFVSDEIKALAGFRIANNLFMGKHLYIDDLISKEQDRSLGYGGTLINWLRSLARQEKCSYLHLDSGTHRHEAHKFYFTQGFNIASYHFSEQLN